MNSSPHITSSSAQRGGQKRDHCRVDAIFRIQLAKSHVATRCRSSRVGHSPGEGAWRFRRVNHLLCWRRIREPRPASIQACLRPYLPSSRQPTALNPG